MNGQVGEEQHVPRLRGQRHRSLERYVGEVMPTLGVVLPRTLKVAARHNADAALALRRVVQVEYRGADPMMGVREERVILVQRERRAVLRRFHEQFGVVQLYVRHSQHGCGDGGVECWINRPPR